MRMVSAMIIPKAPPHLDNLQPPQESGNPMADLKKRQKDLARPMSAFSFKERQCQTSGKGQ
jgi:hypothetical protein